MLQPDSPGNTAVQIRLRSRGDVELLVQLIQELLFEVLVGFLQGIDLPQSQGLMLARGVLPPGESLSGLVSAATYSRVSKRLATLGLPVEAMGRFKP